LTLNPTDSKTFLNSEVRSGSSSTKYDFILGINDFADSGRKSAILLIAVMMLQVECKAGLIATLLY